MADGLTSDHDMIVAMHTTLNRMDKALFGNGQPGLMAEHNRLAQAVVEVRTDLEKLVTEKVEEARLDNVVVVAEAKEALKKETPGKGGQRLAQATAAAAFVVAVIQGVMTALKS